MADGYVMWVRVERSRSADAETIAARAGTVIAAGDIREDEFKRQLTLELARGEVEGWNTVFTDTEAKAQFGRRPIA